MTSASPVMHKGIVKMALSGDTVVIRGQPRGGPPPERTLCFSNITAPRLARRANPNVEGSTETKDEPFAWEAREFIRKKLIGKEVMFTIEYKTPAATREYGCVFLAKDPSGETQESMTDAIVNEGFVELRRMGLRADDEKSQRLIQLEDAAKSTGKGKWNPEVQTNPDKFIRDTKWVIENPRQFIDSFHQKPVNAVIEHVRDGCTVRGFLLPDYQYVTIMLSGIKCPMFKQDDTGQQVPEPLAQEAKFFTESRLLQREVQIIMESVSNQNILGTVLHPNGNIAELLLKEGFARCVDWSMGVVTQGPENLRAAEKLAKENKVRMWKDYSPTEPAISIKDKTFPGKVVECVNGDALVVKTAEGQYKKCFLASIRPPRAPAEDPAAPKERNMRSRPLYDVAYMFEAREFLRKKLIGKKVNVEVDYIQPPNQGFPEKTCCTVTIGGVNVGEALVSKGFATAIRYRQDDDQRSSCYDQLLSAEERAKKKGVGLHSTKDVPVHRVADISGDVPKAKQFLPFLQRAGRSEAVAEFVASGSRLRLYIPRETCLITFLISGIECPRGSRPGPSGTTFPAEPYGEEAMMFTKELCLQREVEVEVETMDKGGNFIGWLYVEGTNLSLALVEEGLAKVHFTAEKSAYYSKMLKAEENAKEAKLNLWKSYVEPKEEVEVEEPGERTIAHRSVCVTEVADDLRFYAQTVENGPRLTKLMDEMRSSLESDPPLPGSYTPKRGDLCVAKFSADNQWYRAKVEKIEGPRIHVFFIDFGNKEVTDMTKLAQMSAGFSALPPQATAYCLACVSLPSDEEAKLDAIDGFYNDVMNKQVLLNTEYRLAGHECVTLCEVDSKEDIVKGLITTGLVLVDQRKEKRLAKLVAEYVKAQDKAKANRMNLWRYGDFQDDDAKEFGYQR